MPARSPSFLLVLAALGAALAACRPGGGDGAQGTGAGPATGSAPAAQNCTEEFAALNLTVLDPQGRPLTRAPQIAIKRGGTLVTHQALAIPDSVGAPGTVTLLDDSALQQFNDRGDTLQITVGAMSGNGIATWVVRSDGCHVRKVSGPDTLRLTRVPS